MKPEARIKSDPPGRAPSRRANPGLAFLMVRYFSSIGCVGLKKKGGHFVLDG